MSPPFELSRRVWAPIALITLALGPAVFAKDPPKNPTPRDPSLRERLRDLPYEFIHESYGADNWELVARRADGSGERNLTRTPDIHEMYPQASPDGAKVCFVVDSTEKVPGKKDATVRSLWVMSRDGTGRVLVAKNARQPCWSPDAKTIAYLPAEFERFDIRDYVTKGLVFFDVATGQKRTHPNPKLHHLYNPCFTRDGKWIVATVHGGMGFGHAILAIQVDGGAVHDLKIGGCRPDISPDGKRIAWGLDDHTIAVGTLELSATPPRVVDRRHLVRDKLHVYHADWSPDGRYIAFSRGPGGRQKVNGPGTHRGIAELVGVRAKWDICAIQVDGGKGWASLTTTGASNKESEWLPALREEAGR